MTAPDLDGDSHSTQIARGDVVEFSITAPIEGAASVHGLSDLVLMKAGERATLRFRAIYGGGFLCIFTAPMVLTSGSGRSRCRRNRHDRLGANRVG